MAKSDKQDLIPCTLEERGRNCIQYHDGRCALLLRSTNRQPCSFYKSEIKLFNNVMPGTSLIKIKGICK